LLCKMNPMRKLGEDGKNTLCMITIWLLLAGYLLAPGLFAHACGRYVVKIVIKGYR
jgi:hypothetical protein